MILWTPVHAYSSSRHAYSGESAASNAASGHVGVRSPTLFPLWLMSVTHPRACRTISSLYSPNLSMNCVQCLNLVVLIGSRMPPWEHLFAFVREIRAALSPMYFFVVLHFFLILRGSKISRLKARPESLSSVRFVFGILLKSRA